MSSGRKYFISGGGTGGHIYPAFTIAEKLLKEEDTEKVYYIGNPSNLEAEIVKKYPEIEFLPVKVAGMPRKFGFSFIKWGIDMFFGVLKTIGYMRKYKPDAVFTTGGYVSAPAVAAAQFLKCPYMIHDCDSVPGLVSKYAAPKASLVSVAFEASKNVLKSKNIIYNGNPVRDAFFEISPEEARWEIAVPEDAKVLYVTGGSQGAKTINDAMVQILKTLNEELDIFVIWQTGKNKYDEVIQQLENVYPEYKDSLNMIIAPYFDETVFPLKSADVVVARAGSLSLSEILSCENPSVLVPYPHAAQDHQRKNAKEMSDKGFALYLDDDYCIAPTLLQKIKQIITDDEKFESMKENIRKFEKKNPADEIVKQLKSIIK